MIKSEKVFNRRAKQLIKLILNDGDISALPYDDQYIIAECIKRGYLNAKYLHTTENGKYHFELLEESSVTLDGLKFAVPQRNWVAIITMFATAITAVGVFKPELIWLISVIAKLR